FAVLVVMSFTIHYRGAYRRITWDWNSVPVDIDADPSRIWDWRDLQFLRRGGAAAKGGVPSARRSRRLVRGGGAPAGARRGGGRGGGGGGSGRGAMGRVTLIPSIPRKGNVRGIRHT